MSKFSPLDLTAHWNASRDNIVIPPGKWRPWQEFIEASIRELPEGAQTFWGVPFSLGQARTEKCWLVLGAGKDSVEINVEPSSLASFILFAHFCNSSMDPNIGRGWQRDATFVMRPGERLADYVLVYADGSEQRQPIRRRFEINEPTAFLGQLAFAARAHLRDSARDYNGVHERGQWGLNQLGVSQGARAVGCRYWVYALPNPFPERPLRTLRLEASGRDAFSIAGITLYHAPEDPFRYRRLETLRIALPVGETTAPVDVDLGIIARTYALPAFQPDSWLEAEPKGCGEEPLPAADPLFVEITAAPDATLCIGRHSVEMRGVYDHGRAESADGAVRVELLTSHKVWLDVTVIDESTGVPTPARVHFRAPDGRYLPPYGHRHQVNDNWFEDYGGDLKLGSTEYAYVNGHFRIELPVGECYVELCKGFEYEPIRAKVQIAPGQRELKLRLERRFDFRRSGWVTADTHVHFLSPQTAWLEAQGEGVNLVNVLASQFGDMFANVADITGDVSGVSREDTLVWVGTENRQHFLGHISLLGGRGEPVFPMCASGPVESYLGDPTWSSMAEWADRCRERDGLVLIPHFPSPYAEVVADIILGKADGIEIRDFHSPTLNTLGITEWYRFLNLGYRVGVVGGTDKMSAGMPVGGVRTYAQVGDEEFTFASWGRAVRAGRTFTTSGPIVGLEVEGKTLGDEIRLPSSGTLEAHAWARSVYPFDVLQLVVNGAVVDEQRVARGTREMELNTPVKIDHSSWIAARCLSPLVTWHCWPVHLAAHTSPVYVTVSDQKQFSSSDAAFMLTLLQGGMTWLDTLSIPADPARQRGIRKVFEDAHLALHRRLDQHSLAPE